MREKEERENILNVEGGEEEDSDRERKKERKKERKWERREREKDK